MGEPHWILAQEIAGTSAIVWGGASEAAAAEAAAAVAVAAIASAPEPELASPSTQGADEWGGEYPWDTRSGQPNDCDGPGSEPCIFVGPGGHWFDFACGPKPAVAGATPGPEITWGDTRRMFSIRPLCSVSREHFGLLSLTGTPKEAKPPKGGEL